ncbi:MAG: superoxide dismutase family protein, partial [bacterium]
MKVQGRCVGLMLVTGLISLNASAAGSQVSAQAVAELSGCTDPAISGVARLFERRSANGIKQVDFQLFVEGLPEGRHAVHVHEVASCEPCAAAGGHFDPGPNGNSSPDGNHPYHLGDLINVVVRPSGVGRIRTKTTRFTLSPGPLSLFDSDGSAFVIHANPDTFCPDGPVPGCAGGERVACGIIEPDPLNECGDSVVTPPERCDDGNTT